MSSEQNQSLSLHWLLALAFVHIPCHSLDGEAGRKGGGRGESSAHAHCCVWYLARTWLVKGILSGQWALFFVLPFFFFFNEWSIFYLFFTFFSLKNWSIIHNVVTTLFLQFSSVQSTQLCPTLCNPMDCSRPGFPVHHQFLELAQTQVRVSDVIQSSHPLSSPSPPAFNFISYMHFIFKLFLLSERFFKFYTLQFSKASYMVSYNPIVTF